MEGPRFAILRFENLAKSRQIGPRRFVAAPKLRRRLTTSNDHLPGCESKCQDQGRIHQSDHPRRRAQERA
ncbi:hypothetical protein KM043_004567 [Ampulex compressa]|nr:hypothetical protein KM043_004567 [Ampulex compressa]